MRNFVDRKTRFAMGFLATIFVAASSAAERPAEHNVLAVWKPQTVKFDYRSAGRLYPCDVLEYKIGMILKRLGAHEHLQLKRFSCHDLAGRARFEVVMQSPIEATEENVRTLTDYDSEDELVARVRGVTLPSQAEIETFPAVWATVSFGKLDLDSGDCALVQQLRRQILPKMAVQVTKDIRGVDCSQELTGIRGPRLRVLALVPLETRMSEHR